MGLNYFDRVWKEHKPWKVWDMAISLSAVWHLNILMSDHHHQWIFQWMICSIINKLTSLDISMDQKLCDILVIYIGDILVMMIYWPRAVLPRDGRHRPVKHRSLLLRPKNSYFTQCFETGHWTGLKGGNLQKSQWTLQKDINQFDLVGLAIDSKDLKKNETGNIWLCQYIIYCLANSSQMLL